MSFNYQKYLASREWALLREAVWKRSGGKCERCRHSAHVATHHLTYERIGQELISDLQGVCRPCHEFLSAKSNVDPLLRDKTTISRFDWTEAELAEEGQK